jgi:hypothetical protein
MNKSLYSIPSLENDTIYYAAFKTITIIKYFDKLIFMCIVIL